jgi:Kef-type K+ transport system membrane component KefB
MLLGAVLLFLLVRDYGETLTAAAAPSEGTGAEVSRPGHSGDVVYHVLLALAAVVIAGLALGRLMRYLGQPAVIGEVVAGILLGPSLLGQVAPDTAAYILPRTVAPFLGVVAQLGAVLYMFLIGLELNAGLLRDRAHATVATSHASIVLPFVLGTALALFLYPRFSSSDVPFTSFALFVGVAMSITAFPVLARILTDWRMHKTPLGTIALTCAAMNDVTGWCLLAMVVGIAQAKVSGAVLVAVLAAAYIAFMFLVVRPVVGRLASRIGDGEVTRGVAGLVFVALLLSSLATEVIGIHTIFGAFLFGAVIPHDSAIARAFTHKLEDIVTVLLLPAFFALTGMRTEIGLVSGVDQWLACGLIILVATVGKFGGATVAARLTGLGWRESSALGILMNTRGLMELIVLNIGYDMKVISPNLFAMMVIMALVTTVATTPILHLLTAKGQSHQPTIAWADAGEGTEIDSPGSA